MARQNFRNRTLWTGDNLDVMRGLNSETVDLIYLDPPFNSNRNYAAPIGSEAAGAAFKDTWTLSDVDEAWHGEIAEANPALYQVVGAARLSHGKGMQAYLTMMAVRLLEMRRLLKPTGSVYLHCDPTASHYLKQLMDVVFGAGKLQERSGLALSKVASPAEKFPTDARHLARLLAERRKHLQYDHEAPFRWYKKAVAGQEKQCDLCGRWDAKRHTHDWRRVSRDSDGRRVGCPRHKFTGKGNG